MNWLVVAMQVSRFLPRTVVRSATWAGAQVSWLRNDKGAQRLSANLHRVTGLEGKQLRSLTRQGLMSSARYYAEVLEMPRITPSQVRARVRMENSEASIAAIHANNGCAIALGHSGNWDLLGARASQDIVPVTSVAEILEPRELFDKFVALRADKGIRIHGHEGSATFRELVRDARSPESRIIALLADRDLSGSGIEVSMWGHRVKVAPGPAAVAVAGGVPLLIVKCYYERLRGERRRAAKSRWGTVMHFGPVLDAKEFKGPDAVSALSAAWAESIAEGIADHPQDWHMLQRFGWVE